MEPCGRRPVGDMAGRRMCRAQARLERLGEKLRARGRETGRGRVLGTERTGMAMSERVGGEVRGRVRGREGGREEERQREAERDRARESVGGEAGGYGGPSSVSPSSVV